MKPKTSDEDMAALREQHWSTEDARRVLEACTDSGLSQADFCRKHGLQAKRLSWWRKRLRDWGAPRGTTVRFAPAIVASPVAMQIRIRLPGEVAIEVANAPVSWVASLVCELRETAS